MNDAHSLSCLGIPARALASISTCTLVAPESKCNDLHPLCIVAYLSGQGMTYTTVLLQADSIKLS